MRHHKYRNNVKKSPTSFKSLIKWITTGSTYFYACAYFLMIPIFAGLYSINREGFYHSTIQYEDSFKNTKLSILSSIKGMIIGNRMKRTKFLKGDDLFAIYQIYNCRVYDLNVYDAKYEIIDINGDYKSKISFKFNCKFDLQFTSNGISGISFRNGDFEISFIYENKNKHNEEKSYYIYLTLEKYPEMIGGYKSGVYRGHKFDSEYENKDEPPYKEQKDAFSRVPPVMAFFELEDIFPEIRKTGSEQMFKVATSADFYRNLDAYILAYKGFPSGLSDHFIRMLYFSVTNITTLGYGDIVPITRTGRLLVALESILGVILIGLFINRH